MIPGCRGPRIESKIDDHDLNMIVGTKIAGAADRPTFQNECIIIFLSDLSNYLKLQRKIKFKMRHLKDGWPGVCSLK